MSKGLILTLVGVGSLFVSWLLELYIHKELDIKNSHDGLLTVMFFVSMCGTFVLGLALSGILKG